MLCTVKISFNRLKKLKSSKVNLSKVPYKMNGCAEFQKSRFAWLIVRLKNNTTALEVTRQELAFNKCCCLRTGFASTVGEKSWLIVYVYIYTHTHTHILVIMQFTSLPDVLVSITWLTGYSSKYYL